MLGAVTRPGTLRSPLLALGGPLAAAALALAAAPTRAHLGVPSAPAAPREPGFAKGSSAYASFGEAERALRPRAPRVRDTAWLSAGLSAGNAKQHWQLAPPATLAALGRYLRPWENHTPDWRAFRDGAYGPAPAPSLAWRLDFAPAPAELPVRASRPCPRWLAPRAVTLTRYAGETERLALFDCDGAIAPEVIDRVSMLSRAPGTPTPSLPLPPEAQHGRPGEWLPGLRLLDPRLVWALGKIGAAFPGKRIVIMSGYRPDAHTSLHRRGKAIDIYVEGVGNDLLFRECRKLRDTGCGYYPNNVFVHLDVRAYGTRHVAWVDVSSPGDPSRYVDGWAGVIAPGEAWLGGG